MKTARVFLWDLKFQGRYGFYFLYGFLTVLYTAVILSLPAGWKDKAAAILIFSDPAAMGLFFMGAIVLFEKSQHVTSSMAVSPLKAGEYVLSKVLSLGLVGVLVAFLLSLASGRGKIFLILLGTFLAGVIFTLCGVIVATRISSLNQFVLATVPVEILGFVPGLLHLYEVTPAWLRLYPINACMDLIAGRTPYFPGLVTTILSICLLFYAAKRSVEKMWCKGGEVKL